MLYFRGIRDLQRWGVTETDFQYRKWCSLFSLVLSHFLFIGQRWTNHRNSKEKEDLHIKSSSYTHKISWNWPLSGFSRGTLILGHGSAAAKMVAPQRLFLEESIWSVAFFPLLLGMKPLLYLMTNPINKVHFQFSVLCTFFGVWVYSISGDLHRKATWVFFQFE